MAMTMPARLDGFTRGVALAELSDPSLKAFQRPDMLAYPAILTVATSSSPVKSTMWDNCTGDRVLVNSSMKE